MSEGYDRNKDVIIHKAVSKTDNRYLNVEVYSYDGGERKARIKPVTKNTNPNADSNKAWINQKAISGLTMEEVMGLIDSLNEVIGHF